MLSTLYKYIILLLAWVLLTQAYPIDDGTNNNNNNNNNNYDATFVHAANSNNGQQGLLEVNTNNAQNKEYIPGVVDASIDNSPNFRVDEAQLAQYTVQSQAEDDGGSSTSGGFRISLLPTPEKTAESVNLEKEGIPSKIFSSYDNTQKKVVDLTNFEPIVDTISEHEKYGNNGDMFDGLARSIVNGYEAFSNLINTFIQKPKDLARSISKGITAQLDIIGGKIVGL